MTERVKPSLSPLQPGWRAYLLALMVTGAMVALRLGLASWFGDRPVLILFVLPIVLSSYVGGLGPGLMATAVAALGTSYLLIPPLCSLAIGSSIDTCDWLILIVVGVLISMLTHARWQQIRREEASARRRRDFLPERKVQVGFAFSLACLGVVGVISFTSVTRLNEEADHTRHTGEVIDALHSLLSTATDVESAQLDYSITGDVSFLESYTDARNRIDGELRQLRKMTADNAEQRRRLDGLAPLVAERIDDAEKNVELRRNRGFVAVQLAITSGRGKVLHDRVRLAVAEMEATERTRLSERAWIVRHSVTLARAVISGGSALAFGCVAMALLAIGRDFAGSRRAEAALHEHAEEALALLAALVESSSDAIVSTDLQNKVTSWNAGAERMFGYAVQEMVGRPSTVLIPAESRAEEAKIMARIRAGESVEHFETARVHKNGGLLQVSVTVSPIKDPSGQIIGASKVARDISERKRAEAALSESREALRLTLDAANIGHWDLDLLTRSANRSPQHDRVFGYPELLENWTYEMFLSHVLPEDRERVDLLFQAGIAEKTQWDFECRIIRHDGAVRWIWAHGNVFSNAAGEAARMLGMVSDITERKNTEARAEWLASFPERNPSPILELDPVSGVVHYVNSAALQQFPDLQREGLHHPLVALIQAVTAQLAEQGTLHRELIVGDSCFSQLLTYIADARRVRIYSTDITERRNAEQALRVREAELHAADRRLAEIVQGMTEGCFAVDAEWRFRFVNDRAGALLQQERDQMIGRTIWETFPSLVGTEVEANYRLAMSDRVPVAFEVYSAIAERWLDVRLFPTGEGLAAFLLDIHDRKMAELEREKFVSLAENSLEFIGMRNLQGRPIFVNRAALQLVGLDNLEQAVRTPPAEFFFPEDQAFVRDEFVPRVLRDGHAETELRFRHFKTGEAIWMIYNAFVVRDSQGQPSVLATVSRNITDRKRAEQEIQQLNADLERRVIERTDQLEAANKELEAFSYSVSHDLRAPLRAVDGFSRIVLEDYAAELPEEGKRHLQTIRDGAQRMGRLIDDLLAFARLSRLPLTKRTVDAQRLVSEALAELKTEHTGRKLEVRLAELPVCEADPALLKQVWMNLLSNAFKYTNRREHALVEIGAAREKGTAVYFVRDNGTGFDIRYAGKLFGVFQRLHRQEEFEGTGVGLAIVQRIVNRHGGRVWADADVGRGATFYFTLTGDAE